jgi:hypothetical protein
MRGRRGAPKRSLDHELGAPWAHRINDLYINGNTDSYYSLTTFQLGIAQLTDHDDDRGGREEEEATPLLLTNRKASRTNFNHR